MRIVDVLTTRFTGPQGGRYPASPSNLRLHPGQSMVLPPILSRRQLGKLLTFGDTVFSHIVQDDLDEAESGFGERFIAPVNQPQPPHHRLGSQRNRLELARPDLLLAIGNSQK